MKNFIDFILELFMIKQTNKTVGLTQFKKTTETTSHKKEVSIKTKDIKLSDLMRHAS